MFENLMNPVFAPLLGLNSTLALLIVSLIIALLITVIYKYTTNQSLMKDLKNELKEFQKEIKELKHDPQKAMAVQKKAMETNMKYMMHSFRSMIFTFIPIIIIFGWLNGHMAFLPIMPGQEFSVSAVFEKNVQGEISIDVPDEISLLSDKNQTIKANEAEWAMKGQAGEYVLEFEFNNNIHTKEIIITDGKEYKTPVETIRDGSGLRQIKINNEPLIALNLGFWKIGWLGSYIIFSIVFSTLLRKLMKVY